MRNVRRMIRNTNQGWEDWHAKEGNNHHVDILFAFMLIKRASFSRRTSFESSARSHYHYTLPVYQPHALTLSSQNDYGNCWMVIGLVRALDRSWVLLERSHRFVLLFNLIRSYGTRGRTWTCTTTVCRYLVFKLSSSESAPAKHCPYSSWIISLI